jgi:hypothetical protein
MRVVGTIFTFLLFKYFIKKIKNTMENNEGRNSDQSVKNDITDLEEQMLDNAGTAIPDDVNLQKSMLDSTDEDGTPLNEGSKVTAMGGGDLDVPGAELDDADEKIGSEDEENNSYSLGDTK